MTWRADWYPNAITALGGLRGTTSPGSDGVLMPTLRPLDTIGVLGQISPGVVRAISSFLARANSSSLDQVISSSVLDDNGMVDAFAAIGAARCPVADYVAGYGIYPTAYKRSITRVQVGVITIAMGETFEPWLLSRSQGGEETELLGFVRQLMNDWQNLIDASASCIVQSGADLATSACDVNALSVFWSSARKVCSDLDVLNENPPTTNAEKIQNAALDAAHHTEQFVGETAAGISQEIGVAAGNAAQGFFSKAGVTSILVAGIAVYLFLR